MSDLLFSIVEKFNSGRLWGKFLDAGTGVNSLKWIQTLPTTSWTAITADKYMMNTIKSDPGVNMRENDSLLVGNWMDESFCESLGKYDTILADYLIGAVDGFSPYEQDTIITRLTQHLTPQGKLYIVGMNPIPDHAPYPGEIVGEVRRARDACILLAGHRPYREFPFNWMTRHLEKSGLKVVQHRNLTILHSESSIIRQLNVARGKLPVIAQQPGGQMLKAGMEDYLNNVEKRVKEAIKSSSSMSNNERIPLSFDYIIETELTQDNTLISMDPVLEVEGSVSNRNDGGPYNATSSSSSSSSSDSLQ